MDYSALAFCAILVKKGTVRYGRVQKLGTVPIVHFRKIELQFFYAVLLTCIKYFKCCLRLGLDANLDPLGVNCKFFSGFNAFKGAVSQDFFPFFYFMNRSHLGPG